MSSSPEASESIEGLEGALEAVARSAEGGACSRWRSVRTRRTSVIGCTGSPPMWSGPPRTNGTSASTLRGRSSRRPPRSGCTGSKAWPSSSPIPPA